MNLGQAVKKARKLKGIKQGALAKSVGVSQTHLSLIENNKNKPSVDALENISKALKIPLSVIMWWAISKEDVSEEKQESFKLISPMVTSLIDDHLI